MLLGDEGGGGSIYPPPHTNPLTQLVCCNLFLTPSINSTLHMLDFKIVPLKSETVGAVWVGGGGDITLFALMASKNNKHTMFYFNWMKMLYRFYLQQISIWNLCLEVLCQILPNWGTDNGVWWNMPYLPTSFLKSEFVECLRIQCIFLECLGFRRKRKSLFSTLPSLLILEIIVFYDV